MGFETFMYGLLVISVLTGLLTEAIKKFLDSSKKTYVSNTLSGWCSLIVSVLVCTGYVLYTSTPITVQLVVVAVALTIMSWICAMVGYDKVVQTLSQLKKG